MGNNKYLVLTIDLVVLGICKAVILVQNHSLDVNLAALVVWPGGEGLAERNGQVGKSRYCRVREA